MNREYTEDEQDLIEQALNMLGSKLSDVDHLCRSVLYYLQYEPQPDDVVAD